MKSIYYSLLACLFLGCASVEKFNQEITTPIAVEALHKDVDKTYNIIQRSHPKLYQYIDKPSLDAKFDSLKNSITQPLTSKQFYEQLAPVVRFVGQGHISLAPPQLKKTKEKKKALRRTKNYFYKMDFINFGDEVYVKRALGEDSLLVKSQVLAVDSLQPKEILNKYKKIISSDGYNTTMYETFIGSRFSGYYAREKGFQDSLQVTFKNKDSIFKKTYAWKKRKVDSTKMDSIKNNPPKKLTKVEKKEAKQKRKALKKYKSKRGYVASKDYYTRTLDFVDTDSTTAKITIKGFSNGDYEEFYKETFYLLDSINTKNLIIDLRNNGGGRLSEIHELYAYLAKEPYVFMNPSEVTNRTPMMKFLMSNTNPDVLVGIGVLFAPIIVTHNLLKTKKKDGKFYYNFKYTKECEPEEKAFKGAVYVIINGNSFSASSIFSNFVQAKKRGTIVGIETGGAYNGTVAGFYRGHQLAHSNVRFRAGLMQIETPYKQEPDGYGVIPDVEISTSKEQWLQDIDAEIQWILEDIKSKRNVNMPNS